ncbi:hypothetical protein [Streptomyces lydicus]|uniref:hypothetical protein n=1 Tax=Streptomyces lydicus TaxID=47763 RepID=UPI00372119D1
MSSTAIITPVPIAVASSATRCAGATQMPRAAHTSATTGSQTPRTSSSRISVCACWSLSVFSSVIVRSGCGIADAFLNPASTRCCLTLSTTVPMSRTTVLPRAWTALFPSPVRTFTTAACAWRLATSHSWENWSLVTTFDTTLCTVLVSASFRGPASSGVCSTTRGGAPAFRRVAASELVIAWTSTWPTTRLVSRSVTAFCTEGSVASGATVCTYLPESEI